jgi:hypothetical protein
MILVADPSKPMELTAKGTLRRQAILDMYQSEIQNAYTAVEASSQTHLILPEGTDAAENLKFMKRVVAEVMLEMPGDDDDIFQHGCDRYVVTCCRSSVENHPPQLASDLDTEFYIARSPNLSAQNCPEQFRLFLSYFATPCGFANPARNWVGLQTRRHFTPR